MKREYGLTRKDFAKYCRKAAADGIILLKNDDKILPLSADEEIAVFGRCQINTYKSGTGSGGAVNVKYTVNIIDAFDACESIKYNKDLAQVYIDWVALNPFERGNRSWASEPWFQQEMLLTNDVVANAKRTSDKAIVVIGRTAGEDKDNQNVAGSYLLTKAEHVMLDKVCDVFNDVVLIVNTANIIDLNFLHDDTKKSIKGVVLAWQGGQETGNAVSDVLTGAVTPSGKLPDTIAYELKDYPSDKNFGSKSENIYQEDIYVGYRYFETFAKDRVMYPFGFGLSYTTFNIEQYNVEYRKLQNDIIIDLEFKVTNTGQKYSGKEVVQVYLTKPQGVLGQPSKELVGFTKTKTLMPSQSQIVSITVKFSDFGSFDDNEKTLFPFCYVLEAGEYSMFYGNSVRNTQDVIFDSSIVLPNTIRIRQCNNALYNKKAFNRTIPRQEQAGFVLDEEKIEPCSIDMKARINSNMPIQLEIISRDRFTLKDVADKKCTLDDFIAQLQPDDLACIVRGEGMCNPMVTPGTASAFGGVTQRLRELGIPLVCCSDGPSGIRMDSGHNATQMPIGTLLAATWDINLVQELYTYEGEEMVQNGIDVLLGPGLNIHRHPLNGRNFEYYSEDPLITGLVGAAAVNGIQSQGVFATLKHFAVNDQETERNNVNSVVSQRALREIHLKCFELCINNSDAKVVMTSYNPINGIWAASNYDLNTTILRDEWGFDGVVMTDWWAKMNDPVVGGASSKKNTNHMVRAQNDIYMVVNNYGAQQNSMNDNTIDSLQEGTVTIGELQRCAKNILSFVMMTFAFKQGDSNTQTVWYECNPMLTSGEKSNNIIFNSSDDCQKAICVEEDTVFTLNVTYRFEGYEVAQSACNVILNDDFVCSIVSNGTQKTLTDAYIPRVHIKKGCHKLKLKFMKKGIFIKNIKLSKE